MTSGPVRVVLGSVILLLTLSLGALSSVRGDGQPTAARLTIVPPSTQATVPATAAPTPAPTPTVAPPTTAAPVTTVPRAKEAPPTTALPTTVTPSTAVPRPRPRPLTSHEPTMKVTPGAVPDGYQVSGTRCFGDYAGVSIHIVGANGESAGGDGGAVGESGLWSMPTVLASGIAPGPATFSAQCFNAVTNVAYFDYPPVVVNR